MSADMDNPTMVCITATGSATHVTLDGDKTLCKWLVHEVRGTGGKVSCLRCQKALGQ